MQLIDARTEEHLWSSNYDGRLDDIFAIQTDVAAKVATALSARIFPVSGLRDTSSIEAYTLYLKARQLWYDVTDQGMRKVAALLQKAISQDPGFARAYASLAGVYHGLAVTGYEEFGLMAGRAEAAAARALELDRQLAEAHSAMAEVHSMLDRFDMALAEAETAVRINPKPLGGVHGAGEP
jgi:adenylate cyclase